MNKINLTMMGSLFDKNTKITTGVWYTPKISSVFYLKCVVHTK